MSEIRKRGVAVVGMIRNAIFIILAAADAAPAAVVFIGVVIIFASVAVIPRTEVSQRGCRMRINRVVVCIGGVVVLIFSNKAAICDAGVNYIIFLKQFASGD